MNQDILDYLKSQKVCVLAVEMMDGSPHGSTLHFAHADEPFTLIFKTDRATRKCEPLFGREKTRATVVVGSNEGDMKTLQMDGMAQLTEDAALKETYLNRFPGKKDKADGPTVVYFTFTATWWRYSDMSVPGAKKILSSAESSKAN
jgi:general stress protein 26